jgi:hypothetical protein
MALPLLTIACILALIPLAHQAITYALSYWKGRLHLFRGHLVMYYADWVFIPFNGLIVYLISPTTEDIVLFLIISLILVSIFHTYWMIQLIAEQREVHLYNGRTKTAYITAPLHFVFSTFQTTVALLFLTSPSTNPLMFVGIGLLGAFLLIGLLSSHKIHGRAIFPDIILIIGGFILLAAKALYLILL